jgi:hypothetical protein
VRAKLGRGGGVGSELSLTRVCGRGGVAQGNLRALLGSLGEVLWEGATWTPVGMTDLLAPAAVKKVQLPLPSPQLPLPLPSPQLPLPLPSPQFPLPLPSPQLSPHPSSLSLTPALPSPGVPPRTAAGARGQDEQGAGRAQEVHRRPRLRRAQGGVDHLRGRRETLTGFAIGLRALETRGRAL